MVSAATFGVVASSESSAVCFIFEAFFIVVGPIGVEDGDCEG